MANSSRRVHFCKRARKVSFANELEAKIALAQRLRQEKGEIRYYQCQFSPKNHPHFHLTSQVEKG